MMLPFKTSYVPGKRLLESQLSPPYSFDIYGTQNLFVIIYIIVDLFLDF